ncbi:hypothetical protein VPH35_039768 [Triticum aestivum]
MRFLRWCGNAWWRCTENGCRCGRPGGRGSRGRRRAGRGSTDDGRRRPAVAEHRFYSCEERVRVLDLECMATASSLVAVPGGGGDGLIPGRRAGGRWRWHSNSSSPSSTQPPSPMSRLPSGCSPAPSSPCFAAVNFCHCRCKFLHMYSTVIH